MHPLFEHHAEHEAHLLGADRCISNRRLTMVAIGVAIALCEGLASGSCMQLHQRDVSIFTKIARQDLMQQLLQ